MITGRTVLLAPMHRMQGHRKTVWRSFPPEERFGIVLRDTKELIGEVNYCNYSSLSREAEIGIEVDDPDRGKGYGEDALFHFLDYLFFTMRLMRVQLAVVASNHAAHNLYQKLGFRDLELVKRGGYDVEQEELVDVIAMALEREEWLRQRQGYSFKH